MKTQMVVCRVDYSTIILFPTVGGFGERHGRGASMLF